MIHERNPESATSETTARECCRDLGANPDRWWGRVNNYILDGYHEGVREEKARTRDAEQAAARMAVEIAQLRTRVAQLEAEADADGCADCGEDCDECAEVA